MKALVIRTGLFALLVAAPQPVGAQASFRSSVATPTGRTNVTTEAAAKINAASRAPIPLASGHVVTRPDMQWVPDRYVPVPGAPQGVLVPGHWERRLSEHEVYVPPLAISVPGGGSQTVPAGVRPPADQRVEP